MCICGKYLCSGNVKKLIYLYVSKILRKQAILREMSTCFQHQIELTKYLSAIKCQNY